MPDSRPPDGIDQGIGRDAGFAPRPVEKRQADVDPMVDIGVVVIEFLMAVFYPFVR
jgi:hypothetical protein